MQLVHLQLQLSLVILSFRELQFQLLLPACTGLQKMGYGATHIRIQLHWQKCAEFCTLWQCVSLHISTSNCIRWLAGWLAGRVFFFFFSQKISSKSLTLLQSLQMEQNSPFPSK